MSKMRKLTLRGRYVRDQLDDIERKICENVQNQSADITLEQLWRGIRRTPTERVQLVAYDELVAEAEIGDLDVHLTVQQQVLSLQVPVWMK